MAFFMDLKAAFDSVDRKILGRKMKRRGVRKGLVIRCEDILRETRCRMRVGGEKTGFCQGRRQGCLLSPDLFNLLLVDIEEHMKRGGWGGVRLLGGKVYTLAYTDDLILLAEEDGMRSMIAKLEGYIKENGPM